MPLSKARDRERKRQSRLDAKIHTAPVQPNESIDEVEEPDIPGVEYIDADGQPVYE